MNTKEDYTMKRFTTIENLAGEMCTAYDAIVRYKDHVCYAKLDYKGRYTAMVYEFDDEPDVDFAEIECRLAMIEYSDTKYKTSGEAIAWCFEYINSLKH